MAQNNLISEEVIDSIAVKLYYNFDHYNLKEIKQKVKQVIQELLNHYEQSTNNEATETPSSSSASKSKSCCETDHFDPDFS